MASKFKQGQNGLLIDPSNERVVGAIDRNGNELLFPYILAQSAVPIILLPAGTWNNTTGDMTLGTALPYQPTGTVLVYLFASGIAQAGLYQATFSANNRLQLAGNPTTVAGAYTPTLNQTVTLASVTLPGGSIGANGRIRSDFRFGYSNSAGNKWLNYSFGGQSVWSRTRTTATMDYLPITIANRGVQNAQMEVTTTNAGGVGYTAAGTAAMYTYTINTAADQQMLLQAQLQSSTADFIILDAYTIEVLPGA